MLWPTRRPRDCLMSNTLAQILADKRDEVAHARRQEPLAQIKARASETANPRNFFRAVTRPRNQLRIIAEIKRASPSAGLIRPDFDPVAIAQAYYKSGAAAISCLTNTKYFQGSLAFLAQIKTAVPLPVLQKDFILDAYQLYQARAAGADAVLLIAECLSEAHLSDLLILATDLKLTTLVEVHEIESLLRVRPHIGFPHPSYTLLGINNRNLKTMTTDLSHTLRMLEMVENPEVLVAESGIAGPEDVAKLRQAGINRILVGEYLLRRPDPGAALRTLLGHLERT